MLTILQGTAIGLVPVRVMRDDLERGRVKLIPVKPEVPALSFRDYMLGAVAFRESEEYRRSKAYWDARVDTLPGVTYAVLQAFTQIHLLTRGGPVDATRVLVYSIYQDAFQNFQFAWITAEW